jgi:hypothetical protein
MKSKEAIQQQAEAIAQWVIDNRYPKSEGDKLTDAEMYCTLIEKIAGCAPVGEAPQIDYRQFVKDYWCLLSTDMDKLDSIELTVTPHQLVAMLKEYAKGGENYGTEASNTDEAAVSTIRSSSGNSVEQVPRTGRIHYGGHRQHTVHYVIADDTKEMIKVSEVSRKIAADRLVEQQKKKRAEGYTGPYGLPHHCFSFNEAVSFTVDEAGEAVIIF